MRAVPQLNVDSGFEDTKSLSERQMDYRVCASDGCNPGLVYTQTALGFSLYDHCPGNSIQLLSYTCLLWQIAAVSFSSTNPPGRPRITAIYGASVDYRSSVSPNQLPALNVAPNTTTHMAASMHAISVSRSR
jgi:hypothetical protein